MMDRDDNHVYQYILNELEPPALGTDLVLGSRGEFPPKRIKGTIANYVNAWSITHWAAHPTPTL